MRIDCHVHITPPDIAANWEKYAQKEPYFSLISRSKVNKFATAENVIEMLDKNNFNKAVVFGFAFRDIGLCRYVNNYVIEKINEFPQRLIGFAVVPPGKESGNEIYRCYNEGLKGVGELFPQGQEFNPENKKETDTITCACKELDIPLLLHSNEEVGHYYPGKTNITLKQMETFVTNHPDLKIILAHFGGGLFFYETMKEIKNGFSNVYYDISGAPFLYDYRIYNMINALGISKRILFGSDFPILSPLRYFTCLEKSNLTENEKQLIFGKNAEKLFSI
ncbi:MAG: amidohydrolase family protein [Treponema sp.]|nr:amidohydrolase family protein [Treponema sp.]